MRPDPKIMLNWIKASPPSDEELKGVESLKPGAYEIYNEKIDNPLLEGCEILIRMGVSSMLRSGDLLLVIIRHEET